MMLQEGCGTKLHAHELSVMPTALQETALASRSALAGDPINRTASTVRYGGLQAVCMTKATREAGTFEVNWHSN